jgi:hypothetical protein
MIHGRFVASVYLNMATSNIPANWTLITMTSPSGVAPLEAISHLAFRNTGSSPVNIGTGVIGSPTLQGILAPNADMNSLPFKYDTGVNIFVQATTGGTINSGTLMINFYQTRH